jgi:polyisoprenoid-binding protein YceI
MMTMFHARTLLAFATVALLALACEDPAKNKTKAVTGEAAQQSAPLTGASAADFGFDQSNSKISWVGSKVTGKHDGGFGTFRGTVHVVDGAPEKSNVKVDIDTASITSDTDKLTGHLRSADFFEVEKYPNASFVSTEVRKGGDKGASHTLVGNLTIHGITKSVTFPANVKLEGDKTSLDAEFAINRKDFGLNYPGKVDDLIRDDVVVKLAIHATRKPAS